MNSSIISFNTILALSDFNALKLAINEENVGYILGNETFEEGTPDVKWGSLIFIEEANRIYFNGRFYGGEIIDSLSSTNSNAALSANQGSVLNKKITDIQTPFLGYSWTGGMSKFYGNGELKINIPKLSEVTLKIYLGWYDKITAAGGYKCPKVLFSFSGDPYIYLSNSEKEGPMTSGEIYYQQHKTIIFTEIFISAYRDKQSENEERHYTTTNVYELYGYNLAGDRIKLVLSKLRFELTLISSSINNTGNNIRLNTYDYISSDNIAYYHNRGNLAYNFKGVDDEYSQCFRKIYSTIQTLGIRQAYTLNCGNYYSFNFTNVYYNANENAQYTLIGTNDMGDTHMLRISPNYLILSNLTLIKNIYGPNRISGLESLGADKDDVVEYYVNCFAPRTYVTMPTDYNDVRNKHNGAEVVIGMDIMKSVPDYTWEVIITEDIFHGSYDIGENYYQRTYCNLFLFGIWQ